MNGEFLLDTNVVIRLQLLDRAVEERLASGAAISLSVVVLGELCFGACKSSRVQANLATIEELVRNVDVINIDMETAREYGRIKNALHLKGRPIPANDIWLAATARQHDLTLVSRDSHFSHVDGLRSNRGKQCAGRRCFVRVSDMETQPDPELARIREVRHRISEKCGHDPKRLVEHYMKLQEERHRDRLVGSAELLGKTENGETDAREGSYVPPSVGQLVEYYHLERYLFDVVNHRFHIEHSIGAFDFFSIIVWKANRAKSKVATKLLEKSPGESELEPIVRRLTSCLYHAPDARERLRLLFEDWRFRLPIASAILTVFWPDKFTVYDIRVCGQLGSYRQLAHCRNFDRLWKGYCDYMIAVDGAIQDSLSLRDKDRYLWARSAATQLQNDIKSGFRDATD